jgi:hypothetical protein
MALNSDMPAFITFDRALRWPGRAAFCRFQRRPGHASLRDESLMQQLGARTMPQALQQVAESLDDGALEMSNKRRELGTIERLAEIDKDSCDGVETAGGMAVTGHREQAMSIIDRALARAESKGERWYSAELLRIRAK